MRCFNNKFLFLVHTCNMEKTLGLQNFGKCGCPLALWVPAVVCWDVNEAGNFVNPGQTICKTIARLYVLSLLYERQCFVGIFATDKFDIL